jgi:hypothetical protein
MELGLAQEQIRNWKLRWIISEEELSRLETWREKQRRKDHERNIEGRLKGNLGG